MAGNKVKIFVINLKTSHDRRKVMEQQLNKLNLSFEIFDAVRGSDYTEAEILKYYDNDYYASRPEYYTAGMVGCTLSHFFLYQKIVAEKIERALILEDDMVLSKNLPELLDKMALEIRNDEVILLFYQSYFLIPLSAPTSFALTEKHKLYQVADTKGLRSTAGYLITCEAAKSMADKFLPLSFFPDEWKTFYTRHFLNGVRVVYPSLLENTYEATTISPNKKGWGFIKEFVSFCEKYKVPPVYQLLRWRRKINTIKTRKVAIVNEAPVDYRKN